MATVEYHEQRARDLRGSVRHTDCCGLGEFSGLYGIRNAEDAKAIRRAAYLAGNYGLVYITATDDQLTDRRYENFRAAGFRKHVKFRNPNTGNNVTLFSAKTLKRRGK